MLQLEQMDSLAAEIAATSARLEEIREELRNTPYYLRQSQGYLSKAAERQRLLGRLEALRRLAQLQ